MQQAEEVAQRSRPPDYVVMVNKKQSAQQMMQTLARTPAKVLLIHNDLTAAQRQEVGNERERMRHWIGTVRIWLEITSRSGTGGGRRHTPSPASAGRGEGMQTWQCAARQAATPKPMPLTPAR